MALRTLSDELINHTHKVFTRFSSNYNLIFGRRGTGKTAWAMTIFEILHYKNPKRLFGGNVRINECYFPIEEIHSLDALRLWNERNKSRKKTVVIDEAGRSLKKRRFMSGINVKMMEDLQVMRKYNLDLIYIASSESAIDSTLASSDYLDGFYDRYSIKHLQYNDVYGNGKLNMFLTDGIPLTSIDFDSYDTATFTEHGSPEDKTLFFEDEKLQSLYAWSCGAKASEVNLTRKTIQKWIRDLTKAELDRRLLFPQRSIEVKEDEEVNNT